MLYYPENEAYGCVVDQSQEHYKRIFALVGIKNANDNYAKKSRPRFTIQQRRERVIKDKVNCICPARFRKILLEKYHWQFNDLYLASPLCPSTDRKEQVFLFLKTLYRQNDILWFGKSIKESGNKNLHISNFCTVSKFLKTHQESQENSRYISPAVFKEDSFSRCNSNVANNPYLVLDTDELCGFKPISKADIGLNIKYSICFVRFCIEKLKLPIAAIISTGSKSLHIWTSVSDAQKSQLKELCLPLGFDSAMFNVSQPARLPATIHEKTNHRSRLIYLNPQHKYFTSSPIDDNKNTATYFGGDGAFNNNNNEYYK